MDPQQEFFPSAEPPYEFVEIRETILSAMANNGFNEVGCLLRQHNRLSRVRKFVAEKQSLLVSLPTYFVGGRISRDKATRCRSETVEIRFSLQPDAIDRH